PHLVLRVRDVRLQLLRQRVGRPTDGRVVDDERRRVPVVEPARVLADGVETFALDPRQHLRHGLPDVVARLACPRRRLLQVLSHSASVLEPPSSAAGRPSRYPSSSPWPQPADPSASCLSHTGALLARITSFSRSVAQPGQMYWR